MDEPRLDKWLWFVEAHLQGAAATRQGESRPRAVRSAKG